VRVTLPKLPEATPREEAPRRLVDLPGIDDQVRAEHVALLVSDSLRRGKAAPVGRDETVSQWFTRYYDAAVAGDVGRKSRDALQVSAGHRGRRYKAWIEPLIGAQPMARVTANALRPVVKALDAQIRVRAKFYEAGKKQDKGRKPGLSRGRLLPGALLPLAAYLTDCNARTNEGPAEDAATETTASLDGRAALDADATACSGGACCMNPCTAGTAPQCGGGGIQSCQAQTDGCQAPTTAPCASGLVCERASGPVCRNADWAEWAISNAPTYIDNGNGTVSAESTGLMWEQQASAETYVWGSANAPGTAQNYCTTLTVAGYRDWRLPTYIELSSLVDYTRTNPSINAAFLNTQYTGFWTSTTAAGPPGLAWAVYFDDGAGGYNSLYTPYYARCVR
jgi:hypothetical protein